MAHQTIQLIDVQMERVEETHMLTLLDYITPGILLGEINFLTKRPRRKTLRAETALSVG